MEKVRPWCGQPSDRGRLKNRTEQASVLLECVQKVITNAWMRHMLMFARSRTIEVALFKRL